MNLFEFIAGMISVILALVVGQLLLGLAGLVQARGPVRGSLTHAAWVVSLFLFTFQHWWSLWDFRDIDWTFPRVLFSLLGPSLLFFAGTLISPHETRDGPIDLGTHFRHVRRPLMVVILATLLVVTLDGPLFGTEALLNRLRVQQLVIFCGAGAVLASKYDRVHLVGSVVVLLALMAGLLIRFFPGAIT
jgi:hypothetical protein